ncbi:hypothetical protein P5P86_10735 [Nocardioides sp. BP30]|uniref:hypothetical protein n=1 Tax=Nocardioides sp. BP30 TaxID=3036374 RepID=UPI002468E561|nr:hypothetical protein [Nocardioides sp. BP30]WGL50443.1 hypothetical protein P5P86_10735 [Nocardioides sp. BP30]
MRTAARRTLLTWPQWVSYLAVLHVVGWISILSSTRDWVGSWKMAYDWVAGSLLVVGPVAAGITAFSYARLKDSSAVTLVRSSSRAAAWAFPALRIWLAYGASTALLALEMTLLALARGVPVAPVQLINVPFLAALSLGQVLAGASLGLVLHEVWAGVLAVGAAFLASVLAGIGLLPPIFVPGSTTGTLVGQTYRPAAMALLAVSAAGLCVVLGAAVSRSFGSRRRWLASAVAVAGLGAFAVGYTPHLDLDGRLQDATVRYECRGHDPALCVASDTPLTADEGAAALRRLARPLVAVGVPLPDRWVQLLPGSREDRRDGVFTFTNNANATGRLRVDDVVHSLAMPAGCVFGASEPEGSIDARGLLATWIALRNHVDVAVDRRTKAWVDSPDSLAWVRTTYAELRACALTRLSLPA